MMIRENITQPTEATIMTFVGFDSPSLSSSFFLSLKASVPEFRVGSEVSVVEGKGPTLKMVLPIDPPILDISLFTMAFKASL